ncbi:uncharacterized protein LOC113234307 [Hyposmocoma kahamanoa]|uniref:uncharacterized protein LOC113234307 n=1 Tax=Hyposmocoma kahamanoa TaxID=1477025 RepID=UPI000E6D8402|nr:uncharacterized protein LOC113234307 [Hyposmocoma kahamanoa]
MRTSSESNSSEPESEFFDSENGENWKFQKRSWIYKLNKSELQRKLKEFGIEFDSNTKVDELRKLLSKYCKNPRNQSSNMANYQLQPFDGVNWECFEQQLECIITLNEVSEVKKVPLLLTKLTPKVLEVLNCLCTPTKPITLSYAVLCKKLREKYTQLQSTALDRATFRSRNQLPAETIEDYVLQLQKLGAKCNFKDLEDQIKEKLIDGVHSKLVKFELLKSSFNLTLEQTIMLARTVEAALVQTSDIKKEDTVSEMFFYDQRRKTEERKPVLAKNTNNCYKESKSKLDRKNQICYCCGANNHIKSQCRLQRKFCSECGRQGHIFKMCSKNKRISSRIYTMEKSETSVDTEEDVEPSEFPLYNKYETYAVNVSRIPPHYITLNIEGILLDFQLDTGSDVTVIPLKDKIKYFNSKYVTQCNIKFKNFDQTISWPVGILENVTVQYEQKVKILHVYIGNDNMPRILGRDWLSKFGLWPPKFLNTNIIEVASNDKPISDAENYVKEKFTEVFSPGWGNFKGETIKLKLKPDAKPKCHPVRRVPLALKDKVQLEFNVGEKVMVKDYRKGHKPWIQGIIIKESIPNTTYVIDVNGYQWKRHTNQMLKCNACLDE